MLRPLTEIENFDDEKFHRDIARLKGRVKRLVNSPCAAEDFAWTHVKWLAATLLGVRQYYFPNTGKIRFKYLEWAVLELHSVELLTETMAWRFLNKIDKALAVERRPKMPLMELASSRDADTARRLEFWMGRVPDEIAMRQVKWERCRYVAEARKAGLLFKDIAKRLGVGTGRAQEYLRAFERRTHLPAPVESYLARDPLKLWLMMNVHPSQASD